jgi:hypothetical protein
MRRSMGPLVAALPPPPPPPPHAQHGEVMRKIAKTAIVIAFQIMKLPPAQYLFSWIYHISS